jgi:DNA-directed RNA polymerase specialized sigma24 family protein
VFDLEAVLITSSLYVCMWELGPDLSVWGYDSTVSLRGEIETLRTSAPAAPGARFPRLNALAAGALARLAVRPAGYDAEDLAADYLCELALRGRAYVEDLLEGGNAALAATVRNRLHQLAAAASPQWERYHGLRLLVKQALEGDGPAVPAIDPGVLVSGSARRLSARRVAAAVAFVLDQPKAPPRGAKAVTRLLMSLYFPPEEGIEDSGIYPDRRTSPSTATRRRHDGRLLAEALREHLPPRRLKVLRLRFEGESIPAISRRLGLGAATVWSYERRAIEEVQRLMKEHQISNSAAVSALEELAGHHERSGR